MLAQKMTTTFCFFWFIVQGDPGIPGFKGEAGPKGEIVSSSSSLFIESIHL